MGRRVLSQMLNCHVPCKEEAAKSNNYKRTQHAKKEATKSSIRELGSHKNLRKPKSLTRGLQATHELGGLNVEV